MIRLPRSPAFILAAGLLAAGALPASAKNIGLFVDGAYHRGNTRTQLDTLVSNRIDQVKMVFDGRNGTNCSQRIEGEAEFKTALCNLQCGSNDTVSIMMMGHGTPDAFYFMKESTPSARKFTIREFQDALAKATIDCRCKIYVTLFSCHSGSVMNNLFKDEHVHAVYTSCSPRQKSTAFVFVLDGVVHDDGDWLKNFGEDYQAFVGTDEGDAQQFASVTAEEKLPTGGTKTQNPLGWRKGTDLLTRAHVEKVLSHNRLQLHFYDPEFIRCTDRVVPIKNGVQVPAGLKACDWILTQSDFPGYNERNRSDAITIVSNVMTTAPPEVVMLAHVVNTDAVAQKLVQVEVVEPHWLFGIKIWIKVEGGTIDGSLQPCSWINPLVSVTNPGSGLYTTTNNLAPENIAFDVTAHVDGNINTNTGQLRVTFQTPSFLGVSGKKTIEVPPAERAKLANLHRCDTVVFEIQTGLLDQNPIPVTKLKKATQLSQQEHLYVFDAALGPVTRPGTPFPDEDLEPPRENRGLIHPEIEVYNAGEQALSTGQIECIIFQGGPPVHADVQPVPPLQPGESTAVVFNVWAPRQPGLYGFDFHLLDPDDNPRNDALIYLAQIDPMPPLLNALDPFLGGAFLEFNAISPPGTSYQLEVNPQLNGPWQHDPGAFIFQTPFGWGVDAIEPFATPAWGYRINATEP